MSLRVFATGSTLSGKTYRLRTLFAERAPRVLVLDSIGNPNDWLAWPEKIVCETEAEVFRALSEVAGRARWRIIWLVELDDPAIDRVLDLLVPDHPTGFSYARAVGGMAVTCDEVAELMPNKGGELTRRRGTKWRKGRHFELSIFAGTQRIPEVHRTVTAQSRMFVVCPQNEPGDLKTLGLRVPPHVLDAARALQPRHCVLWDADLHRGGLIAPDGRVLRPLGPTP